MISINPKILSLEITKAINFNLVFITKTAISAANPNTILFS